MGQKQRQGDRQTDRQTDREMRGLETQRDDDRKKDRQVDKCDSLISIWKVTLLKFPI